jgi:membrane-associated phospholipid phosphatase
MTARVRLSLRGVPIACLLVALPAAFAQDSQAAPRESVKDLPKNILLDQKRIWTSPFHKTRHNAKWWLIVGAATGALIATDRRFSQELPTTADQVAVSRGISRLGAVYTLAPIAGGLFLSGVLTKQSKLRDTGLLGAEALVDGLVVSEVLKAATGRLRPTEGDRGGHFFHGGAAFPSGHTLESFALASVIAHQYHDNKPVMVLAYGLATLVGASRLSARQHSPSDVVAGAAVGFFIGRHVAERRRGAGRSPAKGWLAPQVLPRVRPSDHSYGVLLAWHP